MKKVLIEKEDLILLYKEKKLTQKEIGKIYNVNRTTISNRLREFGISPNPNQRKFISSKDNKLSNKQKELIVGSLLGDGSLVLSSRRVIPYFRVSHCLAQAEYLKWKHQILSGISRPIYKNVDKRGNSIMYNMYTLSHPDLIDLYNLFYQNRKKEIKYEILNYMTNLSLAVWFMDDGTKINNSSYRFSTEGFTLEENLILKDILKNKFKLDSKVCNYSRKNKKYHYLYLDKKSSEKMNELIKEYILETMKYKLIKNA